MLSFTAAVRGTLRCFVVTAGAVAFSAFGLSAPRTWAQTAADQPPLKLRVESNLVVVRVVVRDAQGHPVENLRKEDFRLFDNGKEQAITQFGVEVHPSTSSSSSSTSSLTPAQSKTAPPPSPPEHFVALYLDDLDMPFDDIVRARDAADRYLASSLQPSDRAAIFSSSGSIAVDFTSDLKQLHESLFKLRPSSRLNQSECPNITDYQADRIVNHEDPDAYAVAIDEAESQCGMTRDSKSDRIFIRSLAERILGQTVWQAQYSLQGLGEVVRRISEMPGQRNIVLVSPGFLSGELLSQVDAIIDRALRSQIVIGSIDSKGLAVMLPEADVRTGYTTIDPQLLSIKRGLVFFREQAATSVLAQVAEDTGGQFFHNDNDLNMGIRKVTALSEVYYVLAFAPRNLKMDGRFHSLKVTLSEHRPGVTLQARRGYFAPKAVKEEDETQGKIREAVLSREETQQLPLDVSTELSKTSGKTEFSVMARVDARPVRFERVGDRNVNTLTFVSTIFDANGAWVTGQQSQVHLNLPDDSLQKLLASAGIVVRTTFQLKPGSYTVREVVVDSEDHHLSAISRNVEIH
ncbi:MAG: VWA domain-containing protein [Candidatus Sulfotelmatobacter sp.]